MAISGGARRMRGATAWKHSDPGRTAELDNPIQRGDSATQKGSGYGRMLTNVRCDRAVAIAPGAKSAGAH